MKCLSNETGITMVEVILVLALITLLFNALMAVYLAASNSLVRETNISEMQYTAREARQLMLKDVYSSESLEILGLDGSPTEPGMAGTRLRVIIPLMKEDGIQYQAVAYYIENGRLYRERFELNDKHNSSDDQFLDKIPVADYMTVLSFSTSIPGLIEYKLTCSCDRNTFCIQGRAGSKVDYSIDGR